MNENFATTPSLNLKTMPSYSKMNPNAKCFIPKSQRKNITKNSIKPIFKVIQTNGKRNAPEDNDIFGAPVKKQMKLDSEQNCNYNLLTDRNPEKSHQNIESNLNRISSQNIFLPS